MKDDKYDPWDDMEKMKERTGEHERAMDMFIREMNLEYNKGEMSSVDYMMRMMNMYQDLMNMTMMAFSKEMRGNSRRNDTCNTQHKPNVPYGGNFDMFMKYVNLI